MANVFDVAAYILEKEGEMTTMKLQKLCYYAQAWSLAWEGRPLFDEDFQAWANGPVCRELYNKHAGYFEIKDMHFFDGEKSSSGLTKKEKDIIKDVLETYGDKTARGKSRHSRKKGNTLPQPLRLALGRSLEIMLLQLHNAP